MTILDFFICRGKHWPLSRGYFGSCGHTLVAVAVVDRFKQEPVVVFTLEPNKLRNISRQVNFKFFMEANHTRLEATFPRNIIKIVT